uniref:Ig-like domain-containing protein n=1 Tax=Neolamprologus brichardi TaxID=32507 RepID=A0A3Q4HBQ6_NEOBR
IVAFIDSGDYLCVARNKMGDDHVLLRVHVLSRPAKIEQKQQRSSQEEATLRCNAKGEPAPVITWLSPSNKVISPALDKYQVLDDGTLVVQKIQGFDKGNYTCIARNNAGQDHEVTRLEVLITPPVIRNLTLSAPYYSNRMVVHQNGTLEIHSPKETDSGQLVCIARNEGGEVRLVVNLDVKTVDETPQIRAPKANVQSLSVGNAVALNSSHMLCSFFTSKMTSMVHVFNNVATKI